MLIALGYVGLHTPNVDEWKNFGTRYLGMQMQADGSKRLRFRMDDRAQRLVVDSTLTAGGHYYGWEAADAEALQALAARLDAAGVAVREEPRALADERAVSQLISCQDPAGHRVEIFVGAQRSGDPFVPSRPLTGFRTGSLGLGHAVLSVSDPQKMLAFYRDLLGFRVSDYMLSPFQAYFLHLNARHHSLALIGSGADGLHHLMVELLGLDDVGQAYDLALMEPDRIGVTLGRHSNDFMTSFYMRSPSGCMVEYGWGGRNIDTGAWEPAEFFHGASLWGHERYWLPPEKRQEALQLRLKAAADGFRAPVHVTEGHFRPQP